MPELIDQPALTDLCETVFEESGLTKTQIADVMGVSHVAVHYMVTDADRSMSDLRVRFLEAIGGLTIEGPGYLVRGDRTIPYTEVKKRLGMDTEQLDTLIEDDVLKTTDDGEILHASFYRYLVLTGDEEAEVEA